MPLKQIEKLGATLITSKFLTGGLLEADWFDILQWIENVSKKGQNCDQIQYSKITKLYENS